MLLDGAHDDLVGRGYIPGPRTNESGELKNDEIHDKPIGADGVLTSILGLGFAPGAIAKHGCSNASISGAYGMVVTGTWPQGAIADVGQAVADGAGNMAVTNSISLGGAIVSNAPFTGTYAVTPGCTFTATFIGQGFPPVNVNGVILSSGALDLIETDPGTVVSGSAEPGS